MADDDTNPWERTPQQALPQTAKPGQSEDDSQTGTLSKAWNAWTSRPENNAAMINFGLSMMNPAPGNLLSNIGYGIGSAAEGMGANVKRQEERQQYEEAQALKEEEQARKEEETGYYGQSVRSAAAARAGGGAALRLNMIKANLKAGNDFDKWAYTKDDLTGPDPRMENIMRLHPEIKSKADYLRSPYYQQDKQKYQREHAAEYYENPELVGGGGGITSGAEIPPGARPVTGPNGQPGYWYNGRVIPTGQ